MLHVFPLHASLPRAVAVSSKPLPTPSHECSVAQVRPICSRVTAVSLGSCELAASSCCFQPTGLTTVTSSLPSFLSLPLRALGQVHRQPPGLRGQAALLPATLQIFPRRETLGLPSLGFKEGDYLSTSCPSSYKAIVHGVTKSRTQLSEPFLPP